MAEVEHNKKRLPNNAMVAIVRQSQGLVAHYAIIMHLAQGYFTSTPCRV